MTKNPMIYRKAFLTTPWPLHNKSDRRRELRQVINRDTYTYSILCDKQAPPPHPDSDVPKSNHNPPRQRTIPFPVTQAPINGAYPTIQDITQGQNAATRAYGAGQQIQLERPSRVVHVQAESAHSAPHSAPLDHPAPQARTANPHAQLTQIHGGFHTVHWQPEAPQPRPGPNNGPSSPNYDLLEGVAPPC